MNTDAALWAIGREVFPDKNDAFIGYVLWNFTGYPCFWVGQPESEVRRQLEAYRDYVAEHSHEPDPLENWSAE